MVTACLKRFSKIWLPINHFTDADLVILEGCNFYQDYYHNSRKEYSIYKDLLYKPGHKKVLQHFLSMDGIIKLIFFKLNLKWLNEKSAEGTRRLSM